MTNVPAPAVWFEPQVQRAYFIAAIAHGAKGQMRADGTTPYIEHPKRVAHLVYNFTMDYGTMFTRGILMDRVVAALLHDVLEDTSLKSEDLLLFGITKGQVDTVERMSKPDPHGKAPESYYSGIAASEDALFVKCADRCANLEDALAEVLVEEPTEPRRWGRYVEDTWTHVLPLYTSLPNLRKEIEGRLAKIEVALPAALERRAKVVARQKEAKQRERSQTTALGANTPQSG